MGRILSLLLSSTISLPIAVRFLCTEWLIVPHSLADSCPRPLEKAWHLCVGLSSSQDDYAIFPIYPSNFKCIYPT